MKLEKITDNKQNALLERHSVLSDNLIEWFIEEYSDVLEALA